MRKKYHNNQFKLKKKRRPRKQSILPNDSKRLVNPERFEETQTLAEAVKRFRRSGAALSRIDNLTCKPRGIITIPEIPGEYPATPPKPTQQKSKLP